MAKYITEAITAILATIKPIPGCLTFRGLWHLVQEISKGLRKIKHPLHPNEDFAGYMMTPVVFKLYSQTPWIEPEDVGTYFETKQKIEENKWRTTKDLQDMYENVHTSLYLIFEHIINKAYHCCWTGTVGLAWQGFTNSKPLGIYNRIFNACMENQPFKNCIKPSLDSTIQWNEINR